MAPVELIQRVPLFSDLDRKELESLARTFKEREVAAGDTVVSEDSGAAGFFVIEDGTAKVTVRGEERGTLGPGDYFGEIALIDEGARTATITAETDMRLYGLTFWEFRPLVEQNAGIAWKLLQALARRLRQAESTTR
jgi:CRP/FNR family transcriptional regulator, cyclic AMP receptor protein